MADIEPIGFQAVQTDGIEKGIKKLDELAKQGPVVEKAMGGIAEQSKKVARSLSDLGSGAGDGLRKTGEAAQKAATGLQASGVAAREAVTSTASLARAVATLTSEEEKHIRKLVEEANGLRMSRGEMEAYRAAQRGMSAGAQEIAKAMGNRIEALRAEQRELAQASKEADKYAKEMLRTSSVNGAAAKSFLSMTSAANAVSAALSVIGVGFGAREIIAQIDGYTKFTAQLKLATKGAADYSAAMGSVQRISTDAQQGIGELGTLYARIANGTAALNLSQQKLSDITETVALSLKVSGATASESSSAMLQLSQAFASGVLRGEEFNSVNEAAPRLMKALADGLGVPVGALRKMAEAGQLTSAVLAESLPKALGKLREEAESVQTISGAFTVLKNNIMLMVGAQSNASGATKAFANGINTLANNLDVLAAVGGAVALVLGARFTASVAATGVAFAASSVQAIRYQAALASMAGVSTTAATGMIAMGAAARGASAAMAFLGGPLGAILTVAGAAAAAFYVFRDSSESLIKSIGGLNQPLDELKKKIDALPAEKQIAIKMAVQDEQKSAIKQSQKELDDLIQSVAGLASMRMPADQFDTLINDLREAGKEGGNLAPVLQKAAEAGNISPSILQKWLEMAARLRDAQSAAHGAAAALGSAASSTSVPLVAAENAMFLQRAKAALDASKSYKSEAEKMREVQDVGKKLTAELKALQGAQLGNSKEAKDLEERIKGVNEQLASMAKRGKDNTGATAIKKEQSEYEKLISSIQLKIAENEEELKYGRKLTDADKLRFLISEQGTKKLTEAHKIKAQADLEELERSEKLLKQKKAQTEAEEAYRKFLDGIYKSADNIGNLTEQQNAANASFGKGKVAIAEMAAEQAKLAFLNAKDMGPWTPEEIAALQKLASEHERYVASLKEGAYIEASRKHDDQLQAARDELQLQQYSASLLGVEEIKRNKLIAIRKSELALESEIADIRKKFVGQTLEDEETRNKLIAQARLAAEEKLQGDLAAIENQYINEQVSKYGDIFRQGFADFVNNGSEGLKAFGKSLKTTILTSVADALYKAFAQKFVVNVVASITGLIGGGALGTTAQAAGGGGGGLLGVASNANTVYNLFTGGMAGLLGGWATSIGTMIGSAAMTQFGMGMSGMYLAPGLVGPGVSTAAGAAGASFGGALSAIPGWGWALAGIGALFGKDIWSALFGRKLKESGVEGTFGGENGFEGNLYKYYKGGWFRSNKTTRQEMPEEMRQGFADQFFAMDKSIREMAGAVGLGGEALDGFTAKIKVNLKGLSEEEANKKLQEEFQKIAEQMGGLVLTTEEYTHAGETQLEALARLALSITTVNGVFDALGATLLDASLASADWASGLVEIMGGMDKFSQAASTYYDLYYSDDEKRALTSRNANKGMEDKGLDLRTNDADAKRKYRDLVDKAIADKDEELLAWLLEFADDFSNGVDAVTQSVEAATNAVAEALQKQAEELQRARDETMSTLGLSVDGLVDGFIQEINEGRGATAGTWLADQIVGGFEQAIYEQAITSIINSMIDGMITPMLTAALTGASISEIVSQAAIDQMIASASAAVEVLNTLLNSEDFQKGMEKLSETIASIGNTAGRAIPAMRSYQKQMASTGWDVDKDGGIYNAAEKAAEEAFQGIFDAAKTALDGAVGREKEYWQKFVDNAQESLDKAASFFDLVTDAAKGLRDSLEDVSTMQAAAGMVFLESALEQARQGKGLSDYDKTQEAVSAATGAMVMDNFASQAELDFEKKRLAGQLEELGVFADKQKTDAERLIEQGNAEIDRLDKLLEYWQNYGQASVDATLSVADAVKELEKQASSALGQKMLGVTYDGKGSLASFDVGTNYVPSDMTARIHKGERIIPAADNRALMAALQSPSAGNAELIQAVNRLEQRLAAIEGNTAGTQEYSRRIDGNINQVTEGGNAMRMVSMD